MGILFGKKLRKQREEKGLSGNRLAQLANIPQSNLSQIELGKRPPSKANLDAIASVSELGVSLDELNNWLLEDRVGAEGMKLLKQSNETYANFNALIDLTNAFSRAQATWFSLAQMEASGASVEEEIAKFKESFMALDETLQKLPEELRSRLDNNFDEIREQIRKHDSGIPVATKAEPPNYLNQPPHNLSIQEAANAISRLEDIMQRFERACNEEEMESAKKDLADLVKATGYKPKFNGIIDRILKNY